MTIRFTTLLPAVFLLAALCVSVPPAARAGAEPGGTEATATQESAQSSSASAESKQKEVDVPVPDEPPQAVKTVSPKYPESARKRKQEGTVYVQAKVLKNGKVGKVQIAEGKGVAPDLDKAAIDAVRQWEFTPAKIKGEPVASWVMVPVAFRLK